MKTKIQWHRRDNDNVLYGGLETEKSYSYGRCYSLSPVILEGAFSYKLSVDQYFSDKKEAMEWANKINTLIEEELIKRSLEDTSKRIKY